MSQDAARHALVLCGIQRHMQALGAYGFLSSIRGKPEFLKYVPPALGLLKYEVTVCQGQFPVLKELVDKLLATRYGPGKSPSSVL